MITLDKMKINDLVFSIRSKGIEDINVDQDYIDVFSSKYNVESFLNEFKDMSYAYVPLGYVIRILYNRSEYFYNNVAYFIEKYPFLLLYLDKMKDASSREDVYNAISVLSRQKNFTTLYNKSLESRNNIIVFLANFLSKSGSNLMDRLNRLPPYLQSQYYNMVLNNEDMYKDNIDTISENPDKISAVSIAHAIDTIYDITYDNIDYDDYVTKLINMSSRENVLKSISLSKYPYLMHGLFGSDVDAMIESTVPSKIAYALSDINKKRTSIFTRYYDSFLHEQKKTL